MFGGTMLLRLPLTVVRCSLSLLLRGAVRHGGPIAKRSPVRLPAVRLYSNQSGRLSLPHARASPQFSLLTRHFAVDAKTTPKTAASTSDVSDTIAAAPATTSNGNTTEDDRNDPRIVHLLNTAIRKHPREAIVSLFSLEMASIYGTHSILVASGIEFPTEFVVAFVMARAFRRIRLPLELAVAAGLTRIFPSLRKIKLTELKHAAPDIFKSFRRDNDASVAGQASASVNKPSIFRRAVDTFGVVMDKYGAAYLISARYVGATIVMSLFGAMEAGGFDAQFIVDRLAAIGVHAGTGTGAVVGTWAGAVVISSLFYPFTISCSAFLAPSIARLAANLRTIVRR